MTTENTAPGIAVEVAEVEVAADPVIESLQQSIDQDVLIPRPDMGANTQGVATYSLDFTSNPAGVYKYNEENSRYELDPTMAVDLSTGDIVSVAAAAAAASAAPQQAVPQRTVDTSDQDSGPSSSGITKTGGSTVDLTRDDFYSQQ